MSVSVHVVCLFFSLDELLTCLGCTLSLAQWQAPVTLNWIKCVYKKWVNIIFEKQTSRGS